MSVENISSQLSPWANALFEFLPPFIRKQVRSLSIYIKEPSSFSLHNLMYIWPKAFFYCFAAATTPRIRRLSTAFSGKIISPYFPLWQSYFGIENFVKKKKEMNECLFLFRLRQRSFLPSWLNQRSIDVWLVFFTPFFLYIFFVTFWVKI